MDASFTSEWRSSVKWTQRKEFQHKGKSTLYWHSNIEMWHNFIFEKYYVHTKNNSFGIFFRIEEFKENQSQELQIQTFRLISEMPVQ